MTTASISFEIECDVDGDVSDYAVENVTVTSLGTLSLDRNQRNPIHPNGVWVTTSLLEGVDVNSPDIQRLFANIVAAHQDTADWALLENYADNYAAGAE